ncbi:MAG: hypothetical protein A2138_19375 [Deltaproteobacteria bacterium RBG_16_71_12]|nr:MAG: hypothetical protein A2138_19375 [Deltaproteobacteria bacterium RBG_16_71_12]
MADRSATLSVRITAGPMTVGCALVALVTRPATGISSAFGSTSASAPSSSTVTAAPGSMRANAADWLAVQRTTSPTTAPPSVVSSTTK